MLQVKLKTNTARFSVPVPYTMLNLGISVVTSKMLNRLVNKWTQTKDFSLPPIDKKALCSIIKELKNHKGLVLVEVKAKDGTEVKVKL
jgi:hypothetical protein